MRPPCKERTLRMHVRAHVHARPTCIRACFSCVDAMIQLTNLEHISGTLPHTRRHRRTYVHTRKSKPSGHVHQARGTTQKDKCPGRNRLQNQSRKLANLCLQIKFIPWRTWSCSAVLALSFESDLHEENYSRPRSITE